jgi:hypothetical protein
VSAYELWLLIASIVTAVASVGFVVAMLQTYKGQMNAQVFVDLNARYDDVLQSFPQSAWDARFSLDRVLPPESAELTLAVLRYLNLSSEEYYLYKRGILRRDVWSIWEGEIVRTLRSPLLRREWATLASEFVSYPEFARYVEQVQRAAPNEKIT